MKFFKCAVGLTMLLCLKANAWDFEFGYRNVFSPGAMTYVVEQSNMTRTSEGNITYWNPAANGQEARLTQKFVFAQPTVDAFLNINYIYIANFGGGTYGSGELLGSKDGTNWIQLVNAPMPSIIAAGYGWSTNLPAALLGSRELWIQARMVSQGWNIMAQFLRYDSAGRTDNAFDLKVNFTSIELPTLTLQPQSVTADAGSPTNLSVTATGSDVLRYQWLKDGVALPGATNATLLFSNLQPVNVGDYVAVVSNGGGSVTSSVASVSIPGVNSGLWQGLVAYYPFNGNANDESGNGNELVNNGATLANDRFGILNKSFWFNGSSYQATSNYFPIVGNAARTVSLWCYRTNMPTTPSCVVSWGSGTVGFGKACNLYILPLPGCNVFVNGFYSDVISSVTNMVVGANNWLHLTFTYSNSIADIVVYANGKKIPTSILDATATTWDTAANFPLYIGSGGLGGDPWNGAIDDVRIYNRALSSNDVAALYQSEVPPPTPPAITQNPTDVVATALSPVEFTAAAYSFYPFTYQWQLNGTNLLYATNSTLSILSARQSNVGQYTLIASNAYGSVTSSAATLFLYPYLNAPFTGVVTYWGQTNTLSVGAWGSGSLAYQWYFNGTAIAGATNTTLPLGGIQFTNAGQYSVVVSSSLGSVTNTPYQVVVNPANISLGLFAGVIIQGTVGYSYTIQATTDLSTTNSWATVTNITLTSPIQIWNDNSSDVHSAGNPQKFYQVIPGQ